MADEDNAPATKEGLRIVVAEMEAAKKDAKVAGEFLQQEKKMDDQVAKAHSEEVSNQEECHLSSRRAQGH